MNCGDMDQLGIFAGSIGAISVELSEVQEEN